MDRGGREGRCPIEGGASKAVAGRVAGERTRGTAGAIVLLAKPGIVSAVLLSGYAGMALAGRGVPQGETALACMAALALAAGGAALLNSLIEAERDARMERLARRTAALSRVGRGRAFFAAGSAIAVSLALALSRLPYACALLILAAIVSYVFLYTLGVKRRSPYGAVPGGIPGALPALIGYTAISPSVGMDGLVLFLFMLLWQPPHFWALALKYRDDYHRAGFPVLPAALGVPYTKVLIFLYASALLPASLALWLFGACSGRFAAIALLLGLWYIWTTYREIVARERFGRAFAASIVYLLGVLATVIADVAARG